MIKTCLICNNEFETVYSNKKYCSIECSKKATREADRLRKRDKRNIIRQQKSAEELELSKQRRNEFDKIAQEKAKEREANFKRRLEQGDPLARMRVAKQTSAEYWEAYKEYIIQFDKECGKETKTTVNYIYLLDDNFVEKVVESIKELNYILVDKH